MLHTSQFSEALKAPQAPRPELSFPSEILGDDTLTEHEKLLMIEALFVHDAVGAPPKGSSVPEHISAARPGPAFSRGNRKRLRTAFRWSVLAAAAAAVIIGRARPA
jgi:hypothetical protein